MFGFSENGVKYAGGNDGCYQNSTTYPTGLPLREFKSFISNLRTSPGPTNYMTGFNAAYDVFSKHIHNAKVTYHSKYVNNNTVL